MNKTDTDETAIQFTNNQILILSIVLLICALAITYGLSNVQITNVTYDIGERCVLWNNATLGLWDYETNNTLTCIS